MALRGRLLLLVALALAQAGADLELAVETPQQLLEALAEAAASPGASRLLLTGRVALPPSLANSTAAVVLEDGQELVLSGGGQVLDLGQAPHLLHLRNGSSLTIDGLDVRNWASPQFEVAQPVGIRAPTTTLSLILWPTLAADAGATVTYRNSRFTLRSPVCTPELLRQQVAAFRALAQRSGGPSDLAVEGTTLLFTDFTVPLPVLSRETGLPLGTLASSVQNVTLECVQPPGSKGAPASAALPQLLPGGGRSITMPVSTAEEFMAAIIFAMDNTTEWVAAELQKDITLTPQAVQPFNLPFQLHMGAVVWRSGNGQTHTLDLGRTPELLQLHGGSRLVIEGLHVKNWADPDQHMLHGGPDTPSMPIRAPLWPTATPGPGAVIELVNTTATFPPALWCTPTQFGPRIASMDQLAGSAAGSIVVQPNATEAWFDDWWAPLPITDHREQRALGDMTMVARNYTMRCLPEPEGGGTPLVLQASSAADFLKALHTASHGLHGLHGTLVIELTDDIRLTQEAAAPYALPFQLRNSSLVWRSGGNAVRSLDLGQLPQLLIGHNSSSLTLQRLNFGNWADPQLGSWPETTSPTVSQEATLWPTVAYMPGFTLVLEDSVGNQPPSTLCTPEGVAAAAVKMVQLAEGSRHGVITTEPNKTRIFVDHYQGAVPVLDRDTPTTLGTMTVVGHNFTLHCTYGGTPGASIAAAFGSNNSSGGTEPWVWAVVAVGCTLALAAATIVALLRRRRRLLQCQQQRKPSDLAAVVVRGSSARGPGSRSDATHSGGSKADTPVSTPGSAKARQSFDFQVAPDFWKTRAGVIQGLQLGPLIGRGGYARVYRGRWKGTNVAVKISEMRVGGDSCLDLRHELLLSLSLSHPNVLQGYTCTIVRLLTQPSGSCVLRDASDADPEAAELPSPGTPGTPTLGACMAAANAASGSGGSGQLVPHLLAPESQVEVMAPDSVLDPGLYDVWLVSELADRSLAEAMAAGWFVDAQTRERDMAVVLLSLLDVARGLEHLHSFNIVHGDLKAQNVLLKSTATDHRGFVCKASALQAQAPGWLADFGLSRVLQEAESHVDTGSYGTITHAAPELLTDGRLTKASDVFAFGRLAYELLSGERLFCGMNPMQILLQVTQLHYRPPLPEGFPLADLLQRCWSDDPHSRPDAGTVTQDLIAYSHSFVRQHAADAAAPPAPSPAAL